MMRSMFSGISGLRSHQTMMDIVGNNISNVNTAGYKASVVTFQEALTQTLQGPGTATDTQGGSNPLQIGLGTRIASIDGVFTQGASQVTGRNTDLAIQGEGFFVLDNAGSRAYTRAGNFNFDSAGNLTAPGGARVMGWLADTTGAVDYSRPLQPIQLPLTQVIDPIVTGTVSLGGNLPADAAVGEEVVTTISVYDSIGNAHELVVTFIKASANTWTAAAEVNGSAATLSSTSVTFNTAGALTSASPITLTGITPAGAAPLNIDIDFATDTPLVQFGGSPSMAAFAQDGNAIGFMRSFVISNDGTIVGQFSNGWTKTLGNIATASFTNPAGLVRTGESRFQESINSGEPLVGVPGSGNRGLLSAGTLEMSNVDLAAEFTNMIIAQRGFQANSRIITASDEILSDLVNMKR
jgi:flagellar hook protein FlgE